jgi:hypothetical protein
MAHTTLLERMIDFMRSISTETPSPFQIEVFTGPHGGRYVLTADGRKRYLKRS